MRLTLIVVIAVLVQALGNVLLGKGIKQVTSNLNIAVTLDYIFLEKCLAVITLTLSNPSFIFGLVLLIAFFILNLVLLSKADLSYVMPVTSFSYVLIAVLAFFILEERLSAAQWIGITLISFGVLIVGRNELLRMQAKTLNSERREE
ncbi:MAG: EamA family transporter [Blastocatellia bacterium]|nr:EamA family transporter [Blastocatellia bacterium]